MPCLHSLKQIFLKTYFSCKQKHNKKVTKIELCLEISNSIRAPKDLVPDLQSNLNFQEELIQISITMEASAEKSKACSSLLRNSATCQPITAVAM
jgi:hypothetical protein